MRIVMVKLLNVLFGELKASFEAMFVLICIRNSVVNFSLVNCC